MVLLGETMKKIITMVVLAFVSGCTFVNEESFSMLDVGMSSDEVEGILGNPSSCSSSLGARECIWQKGNREIRVSYIDGRVVVFSQSGLY